MKQRAFFSAFAAILLSAILVQTAAAYPSTARSGTTTVTGAYRPINLDLATLVNGTDALDYNSDTGDLTFDAVFTGSFKGEGYPASGDAGNWRVILGTGFDLGVTASDDDTIITMTSSGLGLQVGTLRFLGGFAPDPGLAPPAVDTPVAPEFFKIFSSIAGPVLEVTCSDGTASCNDFVLASVQPLQHLGPYLTFVFGEGSVDILNTSKTNLECFSDPRNEAGPQPCGSVAVTASSSPLSVPEPATLALLGLGLLGLGLSRRSRA